MVANAAGAAPPLFSILLPSRNRLSLLKFAIESVLVQREASWELIISDNFSDENYGGYVAALGRPEIRLIRTAASLPVTDNWCNALAHATGRYVIMLGDDDALTPDCLSRLRQLIAKHDEPDVVYAAAYHYAYPRVNPAHPNGLLATVAPLPAFEGYTRPAVLPANEGPMFASQALKFRNFFGFNSQYMVWKRTFIDSLAYLGPFFQSPYPDYYSSFITMRLARRIVIDPEPAIVIGISPRSFGFYFNNDQLEAGGVMLGLTERHADAVRSVLPGADHALSLPGHPHYRNWLIANLTVYKNLPGAFEQGVDLRRYRRIQILWMVHRYHMRKSERQRLLAAASTLSTGDRRFFDQLMWQFWWAGREKKVPLQKLHDELFRRMEINGHARVKFHWIGIHADIRDALAWLKVRRNPAQRLAQTIPRQMSAIWRRFAASEKPR